MNMGSSNDLKRKKISLQWSIKKKDYCEECGKQDFFHKEYDEDGYLLRIKKDTGKNPLTVHHIDGNIENNKDSNLQTLCRKCHDYKHNMR